MQKNKYCETSAVHYRNAIINNVTSLVFSLPRHCYINTFSYLLDPIFVSFLDGPLSLNIKAAIKLHYFLYIITIRLVVLDIYN